MTALWSIIPYSERTRVQSPVRAHTQVVVQAPIRAVPEATAQCSTLSVFLSFPLSLKTIKACPGVRNKRKIFKYFYMLQYFLERNIFGADICFKSTVLFIVYLLDDF